MSRSVLGKALDDRARALVWWSTGVAGLTFLFSAMFPSIRDSDAMRSFLAELPPQLLAMFGVDPGLILTGAGFVHAQLYSLVGPLGMLAFCIAEAARATAREERDRTMDLLLSLPLSRTRVFAHKAAALALASLLIALALTASLLACSGPFGLLLDASGLLSASLGLWLLGLVFGASTLAIGALTGNPRLSSAVSAVIAMTAWLITSFAQFYSWLRPVSALSPFSWYSGHQPLLGHWSVSSLWLALTAGALALLGAALFHRRDIGTELTLLPERAERRRASRTVAPRATWLLGSVFGKTLWDYRRTVWLWSGGLSLLLVATAAAWPAMSSKLDAMRGLMASLPRELLAMVGLTDPVLLATPAGFLSSRAYLTIGPIAMIVLCVGAVNQLLAREEQSQMLDLVLSGGHDRRRVVVHKLAAIAAVAGLVTATMTVVLLISNAAWATQIPLSRIVGANVGLALFGLFFAGIAASLWGILGARGAAIRATVAIAVIAHMLNAIGSIVDSLAPLRLASPFYWYIGDGVPLSRGVASSFLLLLAGALGGAAVAVQRFNSRDVGR